MAYFGVVCSAPLQVSNIKVTHHEKMHHITKYLDIICCHNNTRARHLSSSRRSEFALFLPFCSFQTISGLDEANPHWGRWSSFLNLKLQMLMSSRNTLPDIPRDKVLPAIWASLAHMKWTITPSLALHPQNLTHTAWTHKTLSKYFWMISGWLTRVGSCHDPFCCAPMRATIWEAGGNEIWTWSPDGSCAHNTYPIRKDFWPILMRSGWDPCLISR